MGAYNIQKFLWSKNVSAIHFLEKHGKIAPTTSRRGKHFLYCSFGDGDRFIKLLRSQLPCLTSFMQLFKVSITGKVAVPFTITQLKLCLLATVGASPK